jgi:hypothetical protein
MKDPEYTDEEYTAEMQRVYEAMAAFTEADWKAFLSSREGKKRQLHAMSYRMRPRKFAYKFVGCTTGKLSFSAVNCQSLQGDQTQYEWLSASMLRHFGELLRSDDKAHYLPWFAQGPVELGYVYGYTPESQQAFQSFRISKAVKQTIAEHYETKTFREALSQHRRLSTQA